MRGDALMSADFLEPQSLTKAAADTTGCMEVDILGARAPRRLHIVAETLVDVNHCLLAGRGVKKEDLIRVISHTQVRMLRPTHPIPPHLTAPRPAPPCRALLRGVVAGTTTNSCMQLLNMIGNQVLDGRRVCCRCCVCSGCYRGYKVAVGTIPARSHAEGAAPGCSWSWGRSSPLQFRVGSLPIPFYKALLHNVL